MKTLRLLLPASCLLLAACTSTPLPPTLTGPQSATLDRLPLRPTVAVAPYKWNAHSQALASALQSSGVFKQVALMENFPGKPDYIATVEKPVSGTATFPVGTALTLGIVPTSTTETQGFCFSLAPASNPRRKTQVDATYTGNTTLGLAALPLNFSENATAGAPLDSERFQRFLAHRIVTALGR